MDQVLSQQEIDSLLQAVESGEIDTEVLEEKEKNKVKSYDFKRPVRLSKEYISTLSMIFEDFAKIAGNLLSSQVRTKVGLQLVSVKQVSFDEFLHSVPRFTLAGVFRSKPQNGLQVLELNPQLCLQLVELLCGSMEVLDGSEAMNKESFTDIEMALLEEVLDKLIYSFEAVWRDTVEMESKLESVETNPQLLQSMSPNEPVILVTFTIELLENKSFINLCIPYAFFENILDKLSLRNWFHSEKETNPTDSQQLEKNLQSIKVKMDVQLGETIMTLENFLQLELGDIVPLDGKTSHPLVMSVEDQPYYLVKPGSKGNKMAVEVLDYIGGETD